MKTFKQFLLESTDISSIKSWSKKALNMLFKLNSNSGKVGRPIFGAAYEAESKKILKHIQTVSSIAYTKLNRFHELEYTLHLLNTSYNSPNLKDFTIYELHKLIPWLKIFLVTNLQILLIKDHGDNMDDLNSAIENAFNSNHDDYGLDQFDGDITNVDPERMEVPYHGAAVAIHMLNTSKTLEDSIKAITLSLNVCHYDGLIFSDKDPKTKLDRISYNYSPFTVEQYENLSNINTRKIEYRLKKEIG
jgi:hypothetical protein